MNALEVYPAMTLKVLRQHFNDHFPYLQLELTNGESAPKDTDSRTMDELAGHPTHCSFVIDGDMPITELEDNFRSCFGLAIWVKRWTGYAWHDTDEARQWTLAHHNQQASKSVLHRV